jgi:hypothetical protein
MIPTIQKRQTTGDRLQSIDDLPCIREFGVDAKRTFDNQCDTTCRLEETTTKGVKCCVKKIKKRIRDPWLQNRLPDPKRQKLEDHDDNDDDMRDSSFGKFVKAYCTHRKCSEQYAIKKFLKAKDL